MSASVAGRRVVVGVDGSANSIAALHRAVTEARDLAAALEVVLVIPGPPEPGGLARASTSACDATRGVVRRLRDQTG